jgi:hypothetical protein
MQELFVIGVVAVLMVGVILAYLPAVIVAVAVATPIRQGKNPQATGEIGMALVKRPLLLPIRIKLSPEMMSDE